MPERQTLITFRGSVAEFRNFLAALVLPLETTLDPFEEWELECTIARHPAGKAVSCDQLGHGVCGYLDGIFTHVAAGRSVRD